MSLADGMAAINLAMPPRVPRTEYSVESLWAVVKAVTGIDVDEHSPVEVQNQARDVRVLMFGTKEDIRAEVERCMRIGKSCPGYFMAVGNHIPPNTPVENVLYYNEVYEELSRR